MSYDEYFWKASILELKQGYYYNNTNKKFTCLICGKSFENGVIYPAENILYTAKKAVEAHVTETHGSMFDYLLKMDKAYTGLTEHQKEMMSMFYKGFTDKEVVEMTEATNTSTIRNQRFAFREKYKQAKIIVAMTELLEEKRDSNRGNNLNVNENKKDNLIDIHRTATMIDERYAITQSEKDEVLKRYFNIDGQLIIKTFPAKEKNKIIILQHLAKEFDQNKIYSEKEVNAIIKNYYDDISTIRRYLVQYGFLDRKTNGDGYWVKQ